MEVTLDFDAGPGSIPASTIVPDLVDSFVPLQPRNLKSPAELGIPGVVPEPPPQVRGSAVKILKKENSGGQQRARMAIQSMKSPAAAAAAANFSFTAGEKPTMICSVAHRGMELLFCCVDDKVVGVCARTRVTLQYLQVPEGSKVVLITSNPANGTVIVGLSNGVVQTYHPVATSAKLSSPLSSASAFGRYRWVNGPSADCRPIFVGKENVSSFDNIQISSSADYKLLVGHGDQLAVFLIAPDDLLQLEEAEVLWTTKLEHSIFSARISGDGQAIVYVVKGEGLEKDNPFGARTFLRDSDDGGALATGLESPVERSVSNISLGIVYKPGPFLVHVSAVSHINFRGFGHVTSSVTCDRDEGNDLLLTYCESDNVVRIFSQNSWKQLVQWTTPPQTRVDWVRGISAFNLGDLEPRKSVKKAASRPSSRAPSIDESLTQTTLANRSTPLHPAPSTSAGAWIAEITFRSAFPALRLSRLSYLKRGNEEAQAAHFESVSAILPAGSILADGVLTMGDMGMSVQGIWPTWHPWASEGSDHKMDATLTGSAMSFLGLNAGNIASNGFFGDNCQGGTHSPPSELRVIASHPQTGKVVLMEFPMWGDQDFGAMELGSPLRYLLSLSDEMDSKHAVSCLDYESNKLCAQIEADSKAVAITWRKQGTHSLLPEPMQDDELDMSEQHQTYRDLSVLPVPLSLPSLKLPSSISRIEGAVIVAVQWWPDENYGGPPQLLCVCSSGMVLVYEMPPPWSALEPVMPSYDPLSEASGNMSSDGSDGGYASDDSSSQDGTELKDYDVMITPHAEFGIGLRLEAQIDGMPAIAGSYKKHPLNRGRLPAERTGMIILGDELLSVNGKSLEGITFDDIIANVRQVGGDAAPGAPLCMRFRPVMANRRRVNSSASAFSSNSERSARRSREQILGISPKQPSTSERNAAAEATLMISASGEMQQEFARIVGAVRGALPKFTPGQDVESLVLLMPWTYGIGAPTDNDLRGAALLIVAEGKMLRAKRLEVSVDCHPDTARCVDLGSFELDQSIKKMQIVKTRSEHWCLSVCDDIDCNSLVFVAMEKNEDAAAPLKATFQNFPMAAQTSGGCILRAFSSELLGTMEEKSSQRRLSVNVWSALPDPKAVESLDSSDDKKKNTHRFCKSVLSLDESTGEDDEIVDFRFVSSGSLNGYPWIVLLTKTAAIVHTRPGGKNYWTPMLTVKYLCVPSSNPNSDPYICHATAAQTSPADLFPHLVSAIRNLADYCDESDYIRSDWHPDSVLTYVCTDNRGPLVALRQNVKGIFEWLSEWTHPDRYPTFNDRQRLGVTPLRDLNCQDLLAPYSASDLADSDTGENASSLFSAKPIEMEESPERIALSELQKVLCPSLPEPEEGVEEEPEKAAESPEQGGYNLPPPLRSLNRDEIRFLWAIGELLSNPPNFKSLDAPAQHTLFCVSLLAQVKAAGNDEEEEEIIKLAIVSVTPGNSQTAHFSRRQFLKLDDNDKPIQKPVIAAAGGLAALTSSTQTALVDRCRPANGQLDWDAARSLRIPFWIRSNDHLRKMSEEIGKAVFKKTKDIMECALFFIIAGNMRTLKNLALTDHKESGRKFSNFLTGYDFSSPHGRKAAEKNAYSLLRKGRFNVAASFFLLAKPPMLKQAIELILTKSSDLDLAFLVTRLVEAPSNANSSFGGGMAFGAMGGGYGASVADAVADEDTYEDWIPKLGKASKQLLRDRGLEFAEGDGCLRALQLIWLNRREEAARELSAMDATDTVDTAFPQSFDTPVRAVIEDQQSQKTAFHFHAPVKKVLESANDRVLKKANFVIDFVSRPFLLNAMKSSTRSRWASTLLVCHALTIRGIELPSARCLLQNTNQDDYDENDPEKASVFDSFDGPRPKQELLPKRSSGFDAAPAKPQGGATASSIFDSFDTAPPKPKQQTGQMASSIFDSFDAAPPPKPKQQTGQMASSIFDSFDTAPPKPKQEAQSGQMSSSIFDSFDAAPPKPKQQVQAQSGQMSSSIFDSFDAAPPKPKQQVQAQSGQMSSSIFDSFDAAPPKPKQQVQAQSGQMSSSIFDSFDAPAPKPPSKPASIFDSFDPAPSAKASTIPAEVPSVKVEEQEEKEEAELTSLPTPRIWMEWRNGILIETVARRLLREVGRHVDRVNADLVDPPMGRFCATGYPLIPSSAAEVLRTHCDGEELLDNVTGCLLDVCRSCGLETAVVVEQALRILDTQAQPRRIVLATLLHIVTDRADLAEDVIRDAAIAQMQRCDAFALSHDDLVDNGNTIHHNASQYLRRVAVRVSWRLELCLWLHRGGVIPLSGTVLKEAIVAVRVGLVLASWGRNHDCLDALVRNEPDCPLDHNGGRQLWTSMKLIAGLEDKARKVGAQGSGGWEFLVDCRREVATTMLRKRPPGSFIIRPHQDDNGVFTLSFKTNLTPAAERVELPTEASEEAIDDKPLRPPTGKPVKKTDVVQHAIMRLSDAGFRCGSFGPFTSLMKLLEAVSASLPFDLLFDKPPTEGIIKDEDHQPSPNAVFLRKFALSSLPDLNPCDFIVSPRSSVTKATKDSNGEHHDEYSQLRRFGVFSQLLTLSEIRKQLCAVAAADYDDLIEAESSWNDASNNETDSVESLSRDGPDELGVEERYAFASRLVRPFLIWCQTMEIQTIHVVAPEQKEISQESQEQPFALAFTESAIELAPHKESSVLDGGDAMIRRMIQPESGVEFRTLRVGEGGESAMIVLFSKREAISWVKESGMEKSDKDALNRLARMEERRVIEPIALSDLNLKAFSHINNQEPRKDGDVTCYRFVDPWEVEALGNREGETKAAALGREHYLAFSVNSVANSCEATLRKLGGLHLLGLWSNEKGGLRLTKAVASVHPPWERGTGGDLQMKHGITTEPTAYQNAIRQHLYRNTLFRRLEMPQRFLALVQVELLDLKNLTAPGGASLSVYALLRLKRRGSSAPLTHKARTLDSAATHPMKIGKSSGPNAPASWGSLVRFRFPLPEDVECDGSSFDEDREALFTGPPCILQLSVYEKKFMSDITLGGADVKLDALANGGQMEEWVPLRSEKHGVNWFARMRLTLRFELMCLPSEATEDELPSSVGLSKIQQLSRMGGTHEDKIKRSASTPDILSYFESMVY